MLFFQRHTTSAPALGWNTNWEPLRSQEMAWKSPDQFAKLPLGELIWVFRGLWNPKTASKSGTFAN